MGPGEAYAYSVASLLQYPSAEVMVMKLSLGVLGLTFALASLVGCAAPAAEEADQEVVAGSEDAITSGDRKAQLDALRARVGQDFAGVASLRDKKLVFVVKRLSGDATRAVVFARIMKRDAAGRDAELGDADFVGSAYEEEIREGFFDGPEVTAALEKKDGKWSVMKKGELEAYVVGPTDVAWTDWDEAYGLPRAWLGFN